MLITDIIDGLIEAPVVVNNKPHIHFYPSSASVEYTHPKLGRVVRGSCIRKEYYLMTKPLKPGIKKSEYARMAKLGDAISKMFVDEYKEAGLYFKDEVPFFDEEFQISGRIDLLIKNPSKFNKIVERPTPSDLIGIEFKSIGGYHKIKGPIITTKDTPLYPKAEHLLQILIYADHYKKYGLVDWYLFYIDRESLRKQLHKVNIEEDGSTTVSNSSGIFNSKDITAKAVKNRFKLLKSFLNKKETPPRDYELQYSNDKIKILYEIGELNETENKKVESKLKKKALDTPMIVKGDPECGWCEFKEECWGQSDIAPAQPQEEFYA